MFDSPFKTALVCDDGAAAGDAALSAGRFLSDQLGTSVHVVHVVDIPSADHVAGDPTEEMERRRSFTERAAEWLAKRAQGAVAADCESTLHLGKPSASIIESASNTGADLVVLGPHAKELFDFGGTQRAIFAGTQCSIWSQPAPMGEIERILCPCDLSALSMKALGIARDLSRALTIPLHVIFVSEPPVFVEPTVMYGEVPTPAYVVDGMHEFAESRFNEAMDAFDFEDVPGASHAFIVGSPTISILDARSPGDLLVMGTRGHTGLSAALMGGTTYGILKDASGPVLAVR